MTDAATWFGALSATAGIIWTGVSQSRQRSARAQAEGAEQAGRLLALMNEIGLGGSDQSLDPTVKRDRHVEQLHDLQRLIRLGSADFVARALKPPVSKLLIWVTLLYSVGLIAGTVGLLIAAGNSKGKEQLNNLIGGITYGVIGLAAVVVLVTLVDRRHAYVKQVAAAAVEDTNTVLARHKLHHP
jgi:hypothetical protein